LLLAYSLIRTLIAWAQSDREARSTAAGKFDLAFTCVLALAGVAALFPSAIQVPRLWTEVSVCSALFLLVAGSFIGFSLDAALYTLLFTRSREVTLQQGLPRLPVATRATWRLVLQTIPVILALAFMAPSYQSPMRAMWVWFLVTPISLGLLSGLTTLLVHRLAPKGSERSERILRIRRAFDMHDSIYQTHGWDAYQQAAPTPLYKAAEAGDLEAVRQLLASAADPNTKGVHGWTPLMIACANQHAECVAALLAAGADPNVANAQGRSALMFAASYGNESIVEMLLGKAADPNRNDLSQVSALSKAAENGHLGVIHLLLAAGANPKAIDRDEKTALNYAELNRHGEIAATLRNACRTS
jgi:hypothetical protein